MPGRRLTTDMDPRSCLPVIFATAMLAACSAPAPPVKKEAKAAPPVYFKVDPATAGSIEGKVIFRGKVPPHKRVDMSEDPQCFALHKKSPVLDDSIAAARDGSLANVFVYVKQGLEGKKFEPPTQPAVMDQKGCWFSSASAGNSNRPDSRRDQFRPGDTQYPPAGPCQPGMEPKPGSRHGTIGAALYVS